MKLPIRRILNSVPPRFSYSQVVTLPQGGKQVMAYEGYVSTSMEAALCDLIAIAEQLGTENERLRKEAK